MATIELISAILLILSCIFIIIIVFFQGANKGGMSQSITGQSSDNYYQRNMGRSKEMKLKKLTVIAAVIFFVVAIGVNVIAVHVPTLFGEAPATEEEFVNVTQDEDWYDDEDEDWYVDEEDENVDNGENPEEDDEDDEDDNEE